MTHPPDSDVIGELTRRLDGRRWFDIGYPGACDITFPPQIGELLCRHLLNNIGDPWHSGPGCNTHELEREVIDIIAGLLGAPKPRWGYVTSGSTEATVKALDEANNAYRNITVYTSTAAHYSVAKAARLLNLPLVMIAADGSGSIDIADLETELRLRRDRPAAIVATAGTTMTEAVDDVAAITVVCDRLAITRRRIHVDAALSGLPLALLPPAQRPPFGFASGATSMAVSGHKFLSTLHPCAVLIHAQAPYLSPEWKVPYIGAGDTTILGSRSGHTPILLWWVLTTQGTQGLQRRAEQARELAAYTHEQLQAIGWESWRNPHAFTVVLRRPPDQVRARWTLADDGNWAHIICMPGITHEQIDAFITDMRHAITDAPPMPQPRSPSAAIAV